MNSMDIIDTLIQKDGIKEVLSACQKYAQVKAVSEERNKSYHKIWRNINKELINLLDSI